MSADDEPTADGKGRVALASSVLLGALALGGAATAYFVEPRSTLVVLAASACVAFAGLVAAFFSLRGNRLGPSAAAILGSLIVLAAVALGFGAVSFSHVMDAVEQAEAGTPAEPIVDPEFAFELQPPVPSAAMYDEAAAYAVHDRARAGFWIEERELTGLVFVEAAHGDSLDPLATAELHLTFNETPLWQSEPASVRYHGREALRIRRRVQQDDGVYHSESTFFLREGWLHHLYASRRTEEPPANDLAWFPEVLEAFVEHEEAIAYTYVPRPALVDQGPGWRLRNGVYEDAAWGLRLDAGERFELAWGNGSPDRTDGWMLSLARRRPDVYVSFRPTRIAADVDHAAAADQLRATFLAESTLDERSALEQDALGVNTRFDAVRWTVSYEQRGRYGVVPTADGLLEVLAWSPDAEATDHALTEALTGLGALSQEERDALDLEVRDAPYTELHSEWWARGDRVAFRELPLAWDRPDGQWRPLPPARPADGVMASPIIGSLVAPRLGLRANLELYVADRRSAADIVRSELAAMSIDPAAPVETQPLPNGGALGSAVDTSRGERCVAGALDVDGGVYALFVWGPRAAMDENADAVRAAVAGLVAVPDARVGWDEGTYRDPQMGFAFEPRWDPSTLETEWSEIEGRPGRLLHFSRGEESVAILAVAVSPREMPTATAARLLAYHYDWVMDRPGQLEERTGSLGGHVAHLRTTTAPLALGGTTIARTVHGGILYVVLVDTVGVTDPNEVLAGFELLD